MSPFHRLGASAALSTGSDRRCTNAPSMATPVAAPVILTDTFKGISCRDLYVYVAALSKMKCLIGFCALALVYCTSFCPGSAFARTSGVPPSVLATNSNRQLLRADPRSC
jgi:hypothetical protein